MLSNCTVNVLITKDLKSKPMIWPTEPRESLRSQAFSSHTRDWTLPANKNWGASSPERGLNLILLTESPWTRLQGAQFGTANRPCLQILATGRSVLFVGADCLYFVRLDFPKSCWISGQKAPIDPTKGHCLKLGDTRNMAVFKGKETIGS